VYVPALPEHDRVDTAEDPSDTVIGDNEQVKAVEGETVDVRATEPVKP